MKPKKEKYPLPLLPAPIWGQIASELDYHTWSLFRRVSASANEVASQPKIVHSVMTRFFTTRYQMNISILGNPVTLKEHQQFVKSTLDCDNPQAKKLFYFCLHGLVKEIRLLLSSVENPQELIFAPISNRSSSIFQFVLKNSKELSLVMTLLEYLKEHNYAEDPYFLMELFIARGQQEWVFKTLNQKIQFSPDKVENMLLEAAGHGDVNFLCALENHFDTKVSQLSLQREGAVGLCTSSVSRQTQRNGALVMIKFLFDHRNANIEDWSDISLSLDYGHFAVAEYLIQQGAPLQRNLLHHVGRVYNASRCLKFLCDQGAKLDQEFFHTCIALGYSGVTDVLKLRIPISANIVLYTMDELDRVYQLYVDSCNVDTPESYPNHLKKQLSLLLTLLAYPTELLRWHLREIKAALPLCTVCLDPERLLQMRQLTDYKECREFVLAVIDEKNEFGQALITRLTEAFCFPSDNKESFIVEFSNMMNIVAKAEEKTHQINLALLPETQPVPDQEPINFTL